MTGIRVDVSSDTASEPTDAMRRAMDRASLGIRSSKQLVAKLEETGAELLGKESALLMPTGTQANLCAIMAHIEPAREVLLGADSHIYEQEGGGVAAICGGLVRTWSPQGIPTVGDLEEVTDPSHRFPSQTTPAPALICFENSHNASGGQIADPETMAALCRTARQTVPAIHLDGARIFNAAAACSAAPSQLADPVDSLSISLDKGLSAPIGALLIGSRAFIEQATGYRRMLGGYIRKAESLAAAGLIALGEMTPRIGDDNRRAACIGDRLANLPGIRVDPYPVPSNLIMINLKDLGVGPQYFVDRLEKDSGVATHVYGRNLVRLAIHRQVHAAEEDLIISAITELVGQLC